MNYSEKLKSPKWQKKRLEVLQRDNFKCCLCGDEETELHVHHLKYTKEPYDAPLVDLETLCKDCHLVKTNHKETDHGKFIKAIKHATLLCVIFEDKGVGLFYVDGNRTEHCMSFMKNSIAFLKMVNLTKEFWNDKTI